MTTRIALSLPDELVAAARRAVEEGTAASVSAYVAQAMALRAEVIELRTVLDEMDRDLGEPSPADTAWANTALGLV